MRGPATRRTRRHQLDAGVSSFPGISSDSYSGLIVFEGLLEPARRDSKSVDSDHVAYQQAGGGSPVPHWGAERSL